MIVGLHHVAILSSDREKTLRFYTEGLGFSLTQSHIRAERQDEILFLTGYGITLEIFVCAAHPARLSYPEAYGLRHLALRVCEIESHRKRLLRLGYAPEEIRTDFFDGAYMMFVKDPDGLPIELHE